MVIVLSAANQESRLKDNLDREKTAKLLKRVRNELGAKLEDLADRHISAATISNIERAVPTVTVEKIAYLARKLGIDLESLPTVDEDHSLDAETIDLELLSVEQMVHINPKRALKKLNKISIPNNLPEYIYAKFLKGKGCFYAQNLPRAASLFLEVIHLLDHQFPHLKKSNLKCMCYYELSRTAYYQNNFEKALSYAIEGINQYEEQGENRHYKYFLYIGKSIYLEKLNRLKEAHQDLEFLWSQRNFIESQETILLIYEQRSKLLWEMGLYDEAITCTKKGIIISRINKIYERAFDLWTILGSIYLDQKQYKIAEKCFLTALDLIPKIDKKYLFITTYTKLGRLYFKNHEYDKARVCLKEGVKLGETTNDSLRYVQALVALGDCDFEQAFYTEAIDAYQKALDIAKDHNMLQLEQSLYLKLSKCYNKIDDPQKRDTCINNYYEVGLKIDQMKGETKI